LSPADLMSVDVLVPCDLNQYISISGQHCLLIFADKGRDFE
jgi:hypothetical protein